MKIDMEFARRDDCLDKMVPSDLRQLVGEIEILKSKLAEVGICPNCLSYPKMDEHGPFSSCSCGTGEDYAKRPVQRLEMIERRLEDFGSLSNFIRKIDGDHTMGTGEMSVRISDYILGEEQ